MEIQKSYLMWVGSEHYKTIEDWADEAVVQGISKRLPNAAVGQSLTEPGTAIFVAHDEGEFHDCPDCVGEIENPEKRKAWTQLHKINKEILALEDESKALQKEIDRNKADDPKKSVKRIARIVKLVAKRQEKKTELVDEHASMGDTITSGTGGKVKVECEGCVSEWDYRKYNYRLHQPGKYPYNVVTKDMCSTCGGTGQLSDAKVFGMFIPSAVEYILKKEDTDVVKKEMEEKRGFRTVKTEKVLIEQRRKCGIRHVGGVYVVTDAGGKTSKNTKDAVKQMVDAGIVEPSGVEIQGDFVRFLSPIDVDVKRFRGIKSWGLDPRAEDEAEMILGAIEN